MENRHQVFVSSTYKDLIEERQEVMKALLEIDCFPAAMELFPSADDTQWDYIKQIIQDCDYYILILAGRYGSRDSDNLGYTEKEYLYALEINKPVIAFLHENIGALPQHKCEDTDEGKEKLGKFRDLVTKKLCKFYRNSFELGAVVSRSVTQLKKSRPSPGWVRSDQVIAGESAEEVLKLKRQIDALNLKLSEKNNSLHVNLERLLEKTVSVKSIITFFIDRDDPHVTRRISRQIEVPWDDIIDKTLPKFIDTIGKHIVQNSISEISRFIIGSPKTLKIEKDEFYQVEVVDTDITKIILVLKKLGLVSKDSDNYVLTDVGEELLVERTSVFSGEEYA
jgi:hypothetical protein